MGDRGYFVSPTVFADVTDNMRIAEEEVRSIRSFKSRSRSQDQNGDRLKFGVER